MAEAKTRDGKSYKDQLNAVVSAASKMIKQTAEVKRINGLIANEQSVKIKVQSESE